MKKSIALHQFEWLQVRMEFLLLTSRILRARKIVPLRLVSIAIPNSKLYFSVAVSIH